MLLVRGGFVDPGYYRLYDAGDLSNYWSSVGVSSNDAYDLGFNPYGVTPSDYGTRYYGQSVRCVALGG